jgi:hypothetical protein
MSASCPSWRPLRCPRSFLTPPRTRRCTPARATSISPSFPTCWTIGRSRAGTTSPSMRPPKPPSQCVTCTHSWRRCRSVGDRSRTRPTAPCAHLIPDRAHCCSHESGSVLSGSAAAAPASALHRWHAEAALTDPRPLRRLRAEVLVNVLAQHERRDAKTPRDAEDISEASGGSRSTRICCRRRPSWRKPATASSSSASSVGVSLSERGTSVPTGCRAAAMVAASTRLRVPLASWLAADPDSAGEHATSLTETGIEA